jgi:hypothetical protein
LGRSLNILAKLIRNSSESEMIGIPLNYYDYGELPIDDLGQWIEIDGLRSIYWECDLDQIALNENGTYSR